MKVSVLYMGKVQEREVIVPGIVKAGNAYLVQCSRKGHWCYCSLERAQKLIEKHGSLELLGLNYTSREARADIKREHLAVLARVAAEKKALAEKEAAQKTVTPPVLPGVIPAGSGKQKDGKK